MRNCTLLDIDRLDEDETGVVVIGTVFLISVTLLLTGQYIIRTTCVLFGGATAGWFAYLLTRDLVDCDTSVVVAGFGTLLGAVICLCAVQWAVRFVVIATFVFTAHSLYGLFLHAWLPSHPQVFAGQTISYFVALGIGVVGGVVALTLYGKHVDRVVSSSVGGLGIVVGMTMAIPSPPVLLLLSVGSASTLAGITFQTWWSGDFTLSCRDRTPQRSSMPQDAL